MIIAEHLGKQFGDFWAVQDFHLQVKPGEIAAVLGPNGVGKTTTIRMLASLLKPTRGRAVVAGYDAANEGLKVRRHIGVLTEQHGLYTRMPGYEYVITFGQIYGVDDETLHQRAAHWLQFFGLWESRNRRIGTYSKGMRQKLALVRALIHNPPVLLLDEPTSAMDPESARLVRLAIRNLREEQHTILLCTHNLPEAEALADRIAIMQAGRIVASGTPQELKRRYLGRAAFVFTLSRPVERPLPPLPPTVEVLQAEGHTLTVRSARGENDNALIVTALTQASYGVYRIEEVPRRLERVYLEIMETMTHAKG